MRKRSKINLSLDTNSILVVEDEGEEEEEEGVAREDVEDIDERKSERK